MQQNSNQFIINKIARNQQNMSHLSFPQNGVFSFPSFPILGETMKLIETKKNFNITNTLSFFQKSIGTQSIQNNHEDQQNSLQLQINNNKRDHLQMLEDKKKVQLTNHFQQTQPSQTPKKKRAGCICKKTKCLKMYCQCFASSKLCTPQCVCYGCSNNQDCQKQIQKAKQTIMNKQKNILNNLKKGDLNIHEDIQGSDKNGFNFDNYNQVNTINLLNLKQFKGCNCKKSQCQKKYCECFNAGLACGSMCKCQQCANNEEACFTHKSLRSFKSSKQPNSENQ